jgi:hypothetical protein
MTEWTTYAVAGRMIERLLVVASAGVSVYLGYRLFLRIPDYKDAQGEIKLPAMNMSVTFSRVGPGVFFAIFGAAVLLASYLHPITVEPQIQNPTPAGMEAKSGKFEGASPTRDEQESSRKFVVAHTIRSLNGIVSTSQPQNEQDRRAAIRDAKLALMDLAWDSSWGDAAVFKEAVMSGRAPSDRTLSEQTRNALAFYLQVESNK